MRALQKNHYRFYYMFMRGSRAGIDNLRQWIYFFHLPAELLPKGSPIKQESPMQNRNEQGNNAQQNQQQQKQQNPNQQQQRQPGQQSDQSQRDRQEQR
jgi:hypothetical protein